MIPEPLPYVHECRAAQHSRLTVGTRRVMDGHQPREEKLAYVDVIIDLLELHDLADTMIGSVGAGLSQ
jgi:hypothetical protein